MVGEFFAGLAAASGLPDRSGFFAGTETDFAGLILFAADFFTGG
ncbi:MAG TPA: hypothetical protein VHO24_12825 [Opitutaceae bacterium]|nr:hypothetical protein [Opitutaceae bacterium]